MDNKTHQGRLKVVFMGTPDFAAVVLDRLILADICDLLAVYTQPDRPCGRGQRCAPPPVKVLALEHGLTTRQPQNFKDPAEVAALAALAPDLLVVAAYGLVLPQAVLDIPRLAPVNVHASLLPKYRGAAPIQRAIEAGEQVTGITIMRMEKALDSGPMLLQRALAIGFDDTAGTLHDQLADLGGRLLVEALPRLAQGRLPEIPQEEAKATYARKIAKADAVIDWNRPALAVHNHIRAMSPAPGACFYWRPADGQQALRVTVAPGRPGQPPVEPAAPGQPPAEPAAPGTILGLVDDRLAVACADASYLLARLKPQGRREQSAKDFWCGYLAKCDDDTARTCRGPDTLESDRA